MTYTFPYETLLKARALRSEGLTFVQIGKRLGINHTVARHYCERPPRSCIECGADISHLHGRRKTCQDCGAAREHRRKRKHEASARSTCRDCGSSLGAGSGYPGSRVERCRKCVHEAARQRTARWLELRREGLKNIEIAEREGVSADAVAYALQRRCVARFPELGWLPSPHYRRREVVAS